MDLGFTEIKQVEAKLRGIQLEEKKNEIEIILKDKHGDPPINNSSNLMCIVLLKL